MKALLAVLSLTLLAALPARAETAEAPKVTAALVYADWCGSCQVLDPKVKEAKAALAGQNVNFVTLDYTARDSAAWLAQADAAGIGATMREKTKDGAKIKTGQLMIIDAQGEVIETFGRRASAEQIRAAIEDQLIAA